MTIDTDVRIGFIGTGVMGRGMAANLIKAGYKLTVYTRTSAKAQELLDMGAEWSHSPAELAKQVDVLITIIGYPKDVEEVYLGEQGILQHARKGTYVMDMTTSSPILAERIYAEARKKGIHALDAPVSGGDIGAREARLSIMVGGDEDAFHAVRPLLQAMGTNIVHQGGAGAGQHTKMSNQIAIASNMMGVCEALAYAKRAGLDPMNVLKSIESGAAGSWSLSQLGPRMIQGDFSPGFYVKHFIKDMKIALESAQALKIKTPGLALAESLYELLAESGDADSGTQALFKLIDDPAFAAMMEEKNVHAKSES
ncbi:NAD(P)-dependent oxidoreductase [Marinicrinis sediminis]|uniref:NAD(P)-dependent oxidoreductase n=1 Tax=Marinicrinis sediminis TaxID=1652465 RepID=A0ABW5REE8_9BACL